MRALGSLMACDGQVGTEKKARVIHPLSIFLEPNTKLPCYFQWFKKCCESVELFVFALIHARNEGTWRWTLSLVPIGDLIWEPSQPTDGLRSPCLYLYQGHDFLERDAPCSNSYAAICERK